MVPGNFGGDSNETGKDQFVSANELVLQSLNVRER